MRPSPFASSAQSARPIAFAHRGARAERRENTIDAFRRALELGATGLESDAWLTADGVVVLDHDGVVGAILRRRPISALARRELPDHVPALAELYEECGTDFELSLDVKDPAVVGSTVEAARAAGAAERIWLCHHDWRAMSAGWRALLPEVRLVESAGRARMPEGLSARAAALAVAGLDALNLHRSQWTRDAVREVHSVGLAAFAWDAQTEAELEAVLACGVDGVYSDHVARMMRAVSAIG